MTQPMSRTTAIICGVIVLLLALMPLVGSRYMIDVITEIMIYALFALSLNVIIGYSGNVSFGHAAYFAIGGYTNAILLTTYGWPLLPAMVSAFLLATVAAAIVAYFCTRLTDIYFAMLTLAFSMFVWAVAFKWRDVTGGDDGFVGVRTPAMIDDRTSFYYFTLAIVLLSVVALWVVCHSAFGRALLAVRENPVRAGFVGINTRLMRWIAFVVAGAFAGVAGALFGMLHHGVYVESAFWTQSATVLIMTLLGGMFSFFGPMIGATVLFILQRLTNEYTAYWPTVLGTILIIILLFLPDGLAGLAAKVRNRLGGRK
ncbi:MAG: branched-chain amino acid ABC transporter permease [Gammaproteobacteria bacterium]|nr:branched-chain amino acid ABC transporter permease [Gammaproteobacteria bacterium]